MMAALGRAPGSPQSLFFAPAHTTPGFCRANVHGQVDHLQRELNMLDRLLVALMSEGGEAGKDSWLTDNMNVTVLLRPAGEAPAAAVTDPIRREASYVTEG